MDILDKQAAPVVPTPEGGADPSVAQQPPVAQGGDAPPVVNEDEIIAKVTGGVVKSVSEWETFHSGKTQTIDELTSKAAQLEAKIGSISPMAAQINEMLASGKSVQDIAAFVQLQTIDAAALADADAVRLRLKYENPDFSEQEIDGLMELKGLNNPLEGMTPAQSAQLKLAAKEAKSYLSSLKVELGKPNSAPVVEVDPVVAAQEAANVKAWDTYAAADVPTHFKADIGSGEEQIAVSKDAMIAGIQTANQWAKAQKIPFSSESQAMFSQIATQVAIAQDFQNIAKSIRDKAVAETEAKVRAEYTSPPPPPVNQAPPPGAKNATKITYVE